ncbi:MAG: putative mismatch endonuclease Vsr [Spirosoma sp.]|nr:putative mismatch endonuclease Vsr [Spirosoma sp.]
MRKKAKIPLPGSLSLEADVPASASVRRHRGDIMSVEKRSAVMARIKGRNTGPERAVEALLLSAGVTFESHAGDLPGRPDFVLRNALVAVLVDGDFWHGWHFQKWRDKLSPAWEAKIEANRQRDARNIRQLRREGWIVVRLWEHQIKRKPADCLRRIIEALQRRPENGSSAQRDG